ncbi:MAG: RNA-binding transcriptional accessory protein [Bacteroidales bacterium]|nr:RNA-binding transcriptional accessory protein [Candidatus Liminaster caballi]
MQNIFAELIGKKLEIDVRQVRAVLDLLADGCTIPFISRYRKEATGGLDEVRIAAIEEQNKKLVEIGKRKQTILSTIEEQGKLTDDLRNRIDQTWDLTELEDIYLPYKPKRRTRAQVAREKGLEPLADFLLDQASKPRSDMPIGAQVGHYVSTEKGVATEEDALAGARDIIAERVSEDQQSRNTVRRNFDFDAVITSKVIKGKEEEGQNFRSYFDFSEKLSRCASHRLLAIRRGEEEGFLRVSISGDDDRCLERLKRQWVRNGSQAGMMVADAVADGFKRLLKPSIETEYAQSSKARADEEAIRIFARNLEQLLMSAPLGQKRILALDPGFRTGCKVVCLDSEGNLLHHDVIYPHPPKSQFVDAMDKMEQLVKKYQIEAISIGNGTASRETEEFVKGLNLINARTGERVSVFVVSEDGASIYSASKVAREEFPDEDVTVRGAVSIGRRLMDPLAELVKIDPNSIGVGQYQKDVNQSELKRSLDQTVENCVNRVGVNVNTASKHLLTYVSGLGPLMAQNIVDYRAKNGAFRTREELKSVPRMGQKAFQQSAGFLRIDGGDNPLDNSAVHPESYWVVEKIARDLGCKVGELIGEKGKALRGRVNVQDYVTDGAVRDGSAGGRVLGLMTLKDIMDELDKPGRDPRQQLEEFSFSKEVKTLEDVREGMELPGIVTNITNFGAFVDIGVHTQGLVHVSEMADRFVKDPNTVLSLHQHIVVRVKEVDLKRGRLSLSMKGLTGR